MKYEFVAQHKKTWPIDVMCRLLGVPRNGFYGYCKRQNNPDDPERTELIDWIKKLSDSALQTYGSLA